MYAKDSDYRTPQDSGGEQLFRALKYMKRSTSMVVFPRETHELPRSGEPWHRIERLEYITAESLPPPLWRSSSA